MIPPITPQETVFCVLITVVFVGGWGIFFYEYLKFMAGIPRPDSNIEVDNRPIRYNVIGRNAPYAHRIQRRTTRRTRFDDRQPTNTIEEDMENTRLYIILEHINGRDVLIPPEYIVFAQEETEPIE